MTDTSCHPLTGEEINSERRWLEGTTRERKKGEGMTNSIFPHQEPPVSWKEGEPKGTPALKQLRKPGEGHPYSPDLLLQGGATAPISTFSFSEGWDYSCGHFIAEASAPDTR